MRSTALALIPGLAAAYLASAQPCTPDWSDQFAAGPSSAVFALAEFDEDGPGPLPAVLIAGGRFSSIFGGGAAQKIASYDGSTWSQLGPGLSQAFLGVIDLAVFDEDGDGPNNPPRLFVAGDFSISSQSIYGITRWDGAAFTRVGTEIASSTTISALHVWDDDGAGPNPAALYAFIAPFRGVMKWDGAQWTMMRIPPSWTIDPTTGMGALASFDEDGDGPAPERLYLGGPFSNPALPYGGVARWNGSAWEIVGGGLGRAGAPFPASFAFAVPDDFTVFDEDGPGGSPPALFVSGAFHGAGSDPNIRRVARWNGVSWSAVGDMPWGAAWTIAGFDPDGSGPLSASLYVGIDNLSSPRSADIRRWTGSEWELQGSFTGPAIPQAWTLLPSVASGTPRLYFGGEFGAQGSLESHGVAALIGCPAGCTGDLDGDQSVGLADLAVLLAHFGTEQGGQPDQGDLDADGDIDLADLSQLLARFGTNCE